MRWIILALTLFAASCEQHAELSVRVVGSKQAVDNGFEVQIQIYGAESGFESPLLETRIPIQKRTVLKVPANQNFRVWATVLDGVSERACQFACETVDAIAPGTRAKLLMRPYYAGPPLHARLLDRETGQPLEGVTFAAIDWRLGVGGVPRFPPLLLAEKQTDENGDVVLPTIQTDGYHGYPVVQAEMPGYNLTRVSLSLNHGTPEKRAVYRVSCTASLSVELARRELGVGQRVILSKVESHNPYDHTAYSRRTLVKPITGVLSSEGKYEFAEVTSDVPLELKIVTDENTLHVSQPLSLQPQEARSMQWILDFDELLGQVVCDSEASMEGLKLWLLSEVMQGDPSTERCLLREAEGRFVVAETRANASGGFVFPGVAPGTWWIGIAPGQQAPLLQPTAVRVEWDPAQPVEVISLPTWVGQTLQGRVLDSNGQPVEQARVTAHTSEWGRSTITHTNAQGKFRLDGVPSREVGVAASVSNGGHASSKLALVAPDEFGDELVLRLRPGSTLRGTVVSSAQPEGAGATLLLSNPEGSIVSFSAQASGEFEMESLYAGEWNLAATTDDGWAGWTRVQLEAGKTLDGVQVELQPAVSLRLEAPASWQRCMLRVYCNGVLFAWPVLSLNGGCNVVVPPSELTVEAFLPQNPQPVVVHQGVVAKGDTAIALSVE